jgi:hypothetical protein
MKSRDKRMEKFVFEFLIAVFRVSGSFLHLTLAMRRWIFAKTCGFSFRNVFTFDLDAFAQSSFPGIKS